MAVKFTPEGMHTIVPHLTVSNGVEAIAFYEKVFGAEERSRSAGPDGRIMHADLQIGDSHLFLSDAMMGPETPGGVAIQIWSNDPDATFDRAIKAGAKVRHPLQDMFWGDRYGQFVDPYGHAWAVAKHLEDLTPEQLKERGDAFFEKMMANKTPA